MKKQTKTIIWFLVAIFALAALAYSIDWSIFQRSIRGMSWKWAGLAVGVYFIAQTLLAIRWVYLLRVHGINISHFQAIKLTYLGLFYNNMMPGAVGGDLLKGWFITQHGEKHQRVEAAVTVFVDRLVGLVGMILVGALASLFIGPDIAIKGFQIRWLVWIIFFGLVGVSVVFLSRHIRQFLMLSQILERLPFANMLKKIDQAIRIYRRHKATMMLALFLTVIIQGGAIVAVWILTHGLHLDTVTLLQCIVIMPIVWLIAAAIPVPGGLGIMEALITYLYAVVINPENPGEATGQAVALALLYRLMVCTCSLPGALVPIFGGHLPKGKELEQIMEKDESVGENSDQKSQNES